MLRHAVPCAFTHPRALYAHPRAPAEANTYVRRVYAAYLLCSDSSVLLATSAFCMYSFTVGSNVPFYSCLQPPLCETNCHVPCPLSRQLRMALGQLLSDKGLSGLPLFTLGLGQGAGWAMALELGANPRPGVPMSGVMLVDPGRLLHDLTEHLDRWV